MFKHMMIVAVAVLALGAGCKKDKDGGGSGGGGSTATPAGPVEFPTAKAFWDDYTSDKYPGMKLLDRFRPGVKFTGTVKAVMGQDDPGQNYHIWIDVDGQKWIDAQWLTDDPGAQAARDKKTKQGDTVTLTCKITGMTDNFIGVHECTF
jgi:hypothetical protein